MQPHINTSDRAKIAFIISLLTGRALQWDETIWAQAGTVTQSLPNFMEHFREFFGRSVGDSSVGEQLYHLRQGSMSINDYTLKFRTLAAACLFIFCAIQSVLHTDEWACTNHCVTHSPLCALDTFHTLLCVHNPTKDSAI